MRPSPGTSGLRPLFCSLIVPPAAGPTGGAPESDGLLECPDRARFRGLGGLAVLRHGSGAASRLDNLSAHHTLKESPFSEMVTAKVGMPKSMPTTCTDGLIPTDTALA